MITSIILSIVCVAMYAVNLFLFVKIREVVKIQELIEQEKCNLYEKYESLLSELGKHDLEVVMNRKTFLRLEKVSKGGE
jgi:uncharacterized protein YsxB (DUF464 family)